MNNTPIKKYKIQIEQFLSGSFFVRMQENTCGEGEKELVTCSRVEEKKKKRKKDVGLIIQFFFDFLLNACT